MSTFTSEAGSGSRSPQGINTSHNGKKILTLGYHPDGRRVFTGSYDGTLEVWDVERGEQEGTPMKHSGIVRVCISVVTRNGTSIVSAGDALLQSRVKVWDIESHTLAKEWTHRHQVSSLSISPDDRLIAIGGLNVVAFYDMQGNLVNHLIHVSTAVWCMAFSPDGGRLACGTRDDIRVYDVNSGRLLLGPLKGHTLVVSCLLWSRDGSRLFSASRDTTIRCWDTNTGQQIGHAASHVGCINCLSLSPNGSIIASSSADRTVRFLNATSFYPVGQPLKHARPVLAVCFSPSGDSMISVGEDGIMYMWHIYLSNAFDNTRPTVAGTVIQSHLYCTLIPPDPTTTPGLPIRIPPPPNLTKHLVKIGNQYFAAGSFGDVYKCLLRLGSEQKLVAVKAFRFKFTMQGDVSNRSLEMTCRELGIWKRLDHDNIVPFLGIAYGFGMTAIHHHDLDAEQRFRFLLDIANGLHYLHSSQIIHGDLNSYNVLIDANHTARLVDFGYSSLLGNVPGVLEYLQRSTARAGAMRWSAPEHVHQTASHTGAPEHVQTVGHTVKSDVYSFGCVALNVWSGKQPWSEVRQDSQVIVLLSQGEKPGRPVSRAIDDSHWSLIQRCWSRVEERPTTGMIISAIKEFIEFSEDEPMSTT